MYFANANYHVQNPNDSTGNTYVDQRYTYAAPRLGFVWRPTAAVAVRASAGGGFAEAPLSQLAGSNAIYLIGPYYEEVKTNLNLQPERSFGFDLGVDVKLRRSTILSFDVYRSNLYGQLYSSTFANGTYLGLPLYTVQNGNLGQSRYEGVLLDVRHDVPHGVTWALSGGLTRGYVVSLPAGFYNDPSGPCNFTTAMTPDGSPCPNLNIVPGANFNGTFLASIPYAQALASLGYRWNAVKYVDLVGTYYGNNNTYFHPAFVELDGHIGYPL
jgi:outer membrane receptor protein involved in Fe transport